MTTVAGGGNVCGVCGERPADAVHEGRDGAMRMCGVCHGAAKQAYGCACAACKEQRTMQKKKTKGAPLNGDAKTTAPKSGKGAPIGTLGEIAKLKTVRSEPVERKRYHQPLPVRIDEATAHAKGGELARVCRERKEFEDEIAEINRGHRERIKYFKERVEELRIEVEQATVVRPVECVDRLLPTNEIETIRCDTGQVLKVRPARADELQESLLIAAAEGGGDKKSKGKKKPELEPPFGGPEQEPKGPTLEATP